MIFDVSTLDNQDKYRLLSGGVTPRPIAWISTRSIEGVDNLAPYSFFTVGSCNPPVLVYTQINQQNGNNKGTLHNLLSTGECVVNIVNEALLEKMNQTSTILTNDESKFDFANVERCTSERVKPCSVKASPIRYECTLREVISISDLPTGGSVILLDVKSIYVHDDLFNEGNIQHTLLDSVGKLGGNYFTLTNNQVELTRP